MDSRGCTVQMVPQAERPGRWEVAHVPVTRTFALLAGCLCIMDAGCVLPGARDGRQQERHRQSSPAEGPACAPVLSRKRVLSK